MRLDKSYFEEIDNKIKDHKVKRAKALEKTTVIRTDILDRERNNMATIGLTEVNNLAQEQLEQDMIATGVIKKK